MIRDILNHLGLIAACSSLIVLIVFGFVASSLPALLQIKIVVNDAAIGIVGALLAIATRERE